MTFTVYPAIDLRKGKVVRLQQGEAGREKVYGDNPVAVARGFREDGASWIHVVNLDGAFGGAQSNFAELKRIAELGIAVQFGGGLREAADIELALAAGAARVVLGTVALRNPELVAESVKRHGADRIAVGIDARDGKAAIAGWVETTDTTVDALAKRMMALGVTRFIYTDIARDGMMVGPDIEGGKRLMALGAKVILSGGVGNLEHAKAAAESGAEGLIIGKALYEGQFTLREALAYDRK